MNKIPFLTLLVKILEDENVINADFEFAKAEALKELQGVKVNMQKLAGSRSVIEVPDYTLQILGMLASVKLNVKSLAAILAYIKHDVSLIENLTHEVEETPEVPAIAECQEENDSVETPVKKPRKPRKSQTSTI
jgi:hypothetical protein